MKSILVTIYMQLGGNDSFLERWTAEVSLMQLLYNAAGKIHYFNEQDPP